VIDNSRNWVQAASTDVDPRSVLVTATSEFVTNLFGDGDTAPRLALLTMDSPAAPAGAAGDPFSDDLTVAQARASQLTMFNGDAPLRDRLTDAIQLLRGEPAGRRRALLLVSDGNDVASPITYDQILASAQGANVQLFGASVAAQQAAQLEVLAQQTRAVFRNASRPDQLDGIMREMAHAIREQYVVTYAAPLQPGRHDAQVAVRGGEPVRFSYDSGARAPEPKLVLVDGDRQVGWLWSRVRVAVDPGAQRAVRNLVYKVDGRPVAVVSSSGPTTLDLPFVLPALSSQWMITAQVDDGLTGESTPLEYSDSLGSELLTLGGALGVAALAIFAICALRRRMSSSTFARGKGSTGFALDAASDETRKALPEPVPLRPAGIIGRGASAYGVDSENVFFGGISREHLQIRVRGGQVLARACHSPTVGRCNVEVRAPGSPAASVLPAEQYTPVEIGSILTLGTAPAGSTAERPTFVLTGPRRASNALTLVCQAGTSDEDDPARTQSVSGAQGDSPSGAAAAFARWLPR
jgi:hypothetical protein